MIKTESLTQINKGDNSYPVSDYWVDCCINYVLMHLLVLENLIYRSNIINMSENKIFKYEYSYP